LDISCDRAANHGCQKEDLVPGPRWLHGVGCGAKRALAVSIQQKGWTLQLIPDASIEKFDELINRVR
jgi:hypothetical protein